MKRRLRLLILPLMLLVAVAAKAISLEACVDSALSSNPALGAAALEAQKARILKGTAFNPPMTEVTLKQETTGGGGPENGVFFGQEFDFPSLYVARHRELDARSSLAESRFGLLAARKESEVEAAFYEALHFGRLIRLGDELGEIYAEFCRVASARLEQGESSRLELMNASRMSEKNAMELSRLHVQYDASITELRRLTGITGPLVPDPESPELVAPACAGAEFSQTLRGDMAAREVAVAERELSVARNELLPGIRLGATVQALIKSFNPYHIERLPFEKGNFMGFEVGITVPLFFGAQSARMKAADADRRIALLNREAAEAETLAERRRLEASLASLSSQLEYFASTALPRADEIKRLAVVSYELGEIDYIEYIANLETAYGIYTDYAVCINEFNQAAITLNNLCK